MPTARPLKTLALTLLLALPARAQELVVAPYLQSAEPTAMWIAWETSAGDDSRVEWGPTDALGQIAQGRAHVGFGASRHHEVQLTDLAPDTRYFYRVLTDELVGEIHHFQTPPDPDAEAPTRLVAMSDMQRDNGNPDVFRRLVDEGVIPTARAAFDDDLARALDLVLIPGDLVDNGLLYWQWADHFFGPAQALLRQVPTYPVLGNHEINAPAYFDYFHLPENGTAGFDEHWYYVDHSNLRVIGLDSNPLYRLPAQLDWLDGVLADACADDRLDFVFAQLHHPHHSELWPAGNAEFTGDVIERLEGFSTDCGKPSVHFYGHTHAYSRGQSRDHQHLMVNVASAGGNLDYWGEYAQIDYPEHTVSQDDYGFVLVEVAAGDDPRFRLRRYSQGQPDSPLDNVLRDDIQVRIVNQAPDVPGPWGPLGDRVNPGCFTVGITPYADPEDDAQQATHWQVGREGPDGCVFEPPVRDAWRQRQNWYDDEDLQADDDLGDEVFRDLEPATAYCWRARVRDSNLRWSAWSAPERFVTRAGGDQALGLLNGDAEQGTAHWRVEAGVFEAVRDGQCAGGDPYEGHQHFSVGGVCDSSELGVASQRVDVSAHGAALDAGERVLRFGGYLRTYNGRDRPDLWLRFFDGEGDLLGETAPVGTSAARWTLVADEAAPPLGTRAVELVLRGQRNAGSDNDSYFDGLFLRLGELAACDPLPARVIPPDGGMPDAGPEDSGFADAEASDAGPGDDGILDAAADRGAPDAASMPDAGPDALRDAEAAPDAVGINPLPEPAGDGCRSSGDAPARPWLLLALIAVRRPRRRRAQGQGHRA